MHKDTFFLDGIDARSFGINLQKPLVFSEPVPVVDSKEVEGRSGNILYDTKGFENRQATASCFALQENVSEAIASINRFLLRDRGYRKLETDDRPNVYWKARVTNGAKIDQRARLLAPFDIKFDCKPFCYRKDGDIAIEFLTGGKLYNDYFHDAKPLIKVYGTGAGRLNIGAYSVDFLENTTLKDGYPVYLDCEMQNAYNVNGNQNNTIKADEFPVLVDGENTISFSGGISKIEIVPRWVEL